MNVLLTGASSFTGYWFANALITLGFNVVAFMRGVEEDYTNGVRGERVRQLRDVAQRVFSVPFGSQAFLDAVAGCKWDILCHHAARVGDYRSSEFDISGAVSDNTKNLKQVLNKLGAAGLKGVVLTGSVFERDEGVGDRPLIAFSPYGVSKGVTAQIVEYHCRAAGIAYGKFVIPNPFGPLEEPRFCAYLMRAWKRGEVAKVNTPDYVRDNIHVQLLAKAYAQFSATVAERRAVTSRLNPSGYIESQGSFAKRFALEMQPRLQLPCALELSRQTAFSEPMFRVNFDCASQYVKEWDEDCAWDDIAEYYSSLS